MGMYCKIWFVLSAVSVLAIEQQGDTLPHAGTIDERSGSQGSSLESILKEFRGDLTHVKTKLKDHAQSANSKIDQNRWTISDVEETVDRFGIKLQDNKKDTNLLMAAVKAFRNELNQYKNRLIQVEKKLDAPALQHSYLDETAQAMCASASSKVGHVMAVRRGCGVPGTPTCHSICTSAPIVARMKSHGHPGSVCYDAYHIYPYYKRLPTNVGKPYSQWASGSAGTMSYHYGYHSGCTWQIGHCGPNYCCCRNT